LVLETKSFADAHSPLRDTLIVPAIPIKELVTAGFFGTGTLPSGLPSDNNIVSTGVLVSLGGNTMDVVRGRVHHRHDAVVTFEQKDADGNYRFRVVQRFALRLKNIDAVARLEFSSTAQP